MTELEFSPRESSEGLIPLPSHILVEYVPFHRILELLKLQLALVALRGRSSGCLVGNITEPRGLFSVTRERERKPGQVIHPKSTRLPPDLGACAVSWNFEYS